MRSDGRVPRSLVSIQIDPGVIGEVVRCVLSAGVWHDGSVKLHWPSSIGFLALTTMAVIAVSSTWSVLSATYDEPLHVTCGMEWLDPGTYDYWPEQPPLARVAVALGPYLKGRRFMPGPDPLEGNAILYPGGLHSGILESARSGTLFFLVLACLAVFLWARRWFGNASAFWAVLLFVSVPPFLGHAGLATLDAGCAATVAIALYAFLRCLESPVWQRLVLLGAAIALAFLTKFSSIGFLGACFLCAFAYLAVRNRGGSLNSIPWRRLSARVLLVSAVAFVVMWAGYRFSVSPYLYPGSDHPRLESVLAKMPVLRGPVHQALEAPLPLRQFVRGIRDLAQHNKQGHASYLFGEFRMKGWWYFFPVVVGVKTPIGFLLLAAFGMAAILWDLRSGPWQQHLTLIFPIVILLVCMGSGIDLGVRHILAIYPPLAVIGGYAIARFFVLAERTSRAILILAAWAAADTWMAGPDYPAYFNQLAGGHPERILVESDLDWGQDLNRLSRRLKELRVDHVSLKYFGTAPLDLAGLPPYDEASPVVPTNPGYLAVSVRYVTLEHARNGSFDWLKDRTPLERIGKSIYLYDLGR